MLDRVLNQIDRLTDLLIFQNILRHAMHRVRHDVCMTRHFHYNLPLLQADNLVPKTAPQLPDTYY
jgi:hypothetical protein